LPDLNLPREDLRQLILTEAAAGHIMTLSEIAARGSISIRTAHTLRSALVKEGLIPSGSIRRGGRREKNPPPPPSGDSPRSIEDILASPSLTTDQQRSLLSHIILTSAVEANRVAAQNALTRLDAQAGATTRVGPGAPKSEEQRIARLSLLMRACGLVTVRAALRISFPKAFAKYDAMLRTEEEPDEEPRPEEPLS
jgi:hypothetical protein